MKTACKEVTKTSDASSKSLKLELKKIDYVVVETSSKNLKVSRKCSKKSTPNYSDNIFCVCHVVYCVLCSVVVVFLCLLSRLSFILIVSLYWPRCLSRNR